MLMYIILEVGYFNYIFILFISFYIETNGHITDKLYRKYYPVNTLCGTIRQSAEPERRYIA